MSAPTADDLRKICLWADRKLYAWEDHVARTATRETAGVPSGLTSGEREEMFQEARRVQKVRIMRDAILDALRDGWPE